jgi:hypothetical protein
MTIGSFVDVVTAGSASPTAGAIRARIIVIYIT